MSLITEFTSSIRLYAYSEKSVLLVTPPDWGKENSTTLKTFGKFGTNFKINEEKTWGWIIPKFKQDEAVSKVESLLKGSRPRPSSPAESQLSDESFAFDDEDDTPKPSLLRAKTLGVSMTKLQKEEEKLRDPFSLCADIKKYMTSGGFHFREKTIGTWKHYFMAGSREKVSEEVEKIIAQYHPQGYSTGIDIDISSGLSRAVIMSHSMSCD